MLRDFDMNLSLDHIGHMFSMLSRKIFYLLNNETLGKYWIVFRCQYRFLWEIVVVLGFYVMGNCCCVRVLRPPNSQGHTETGPRFKVSTERLILLKLTVFITTGYRCWQRIGFVNQNMFCK